MVGSDQAKKRFSVLIHFLNIDLFDQKPFGSKMSVIATGTGIFTVLGVVVKKGFWKKRKAFFANGRDVSGVKKCEKK